ncbi:hypothetical protein SHI21_19930 [Bacteriovorax sp. PP10]|uniref:Uncharacterized protein n=1 Tax=Bacteriovorax antarcticus TaxID=3088717 RepID=A0ABU5VZT6_9BACT|nr:hypothetical protein [Bacteriovorax sp. PP10]MEA9358516.1 hypothetical protein [Bacteriovorax sp. PP10]
MLKKNKVLFGIFCCVMSAQIQAIECGSFNTKFIEKNKTIIKKEKLCLRVNGKATSASSPDCQMTDSKKCPFSALKKGPDYKTFISEVGSPGFNLCHSIGGLPQLYEIEVNSKWQAYERCFWKDSKEFVDIDYLVLYYSSL